MNLTIDLPLQPGVFHATSDMNNGMFGVFLDSLPDGWGEQIITQYLKLYGISYDKLSVLEQLAYIGCIGRGALEYVPTRGLQTTLGNIDYDEISAAINKVLSDEEITSEEALLLVMGSGTAGGARPKVFADIDGTGWMVKFPAKSDPADVGKSEYEHTLAAGDCGITIPCLRRNALTVPLMGEKYTQFQWRGL